MKLKILTENTVFQSQMKAELGFSLLIESDDKRKFLFDTGQTDLYAFNAAIGGVDISEIEAVIISHGTTTTPVGWPTSLPTTTMRLSTPNLDLRRSASAEATAALAYP